MAARSLSALRQAVQDQGYGSDLASEQNGWLNSEYRSIAGLRRWKWLEERATTTTTAGVAAVTLTGVAPDMRNLDVVRLADSGGNEMHLDHKPTNWVQDKIHRFNQLTDQGAPRWWAYFAGQLWLYPIPDGVYTVTFDYTKNVTAMVSDSDVPIIPEEYDDILVWGAVARNSVRQNNWLTRDYADAQKQMLINRMLDQDTMEQRQNTDEVEWTGMWDSYVHGMG